MDLKKGFKLAIVVVIIFTFMFQLNAQKSDSTSYHLPQILLHDIDGKLVNISEIPNTNNPFILCFWKTCCKKPSQYLDAINDVYSEMIDSSNVILYAIAIDDSRTANQVRPFTQSHGWEFKVLLDTNSELKRAMNVSVTPHTFLFNAKGELVWQKMMYYPGDEYEILERIKEL